MRWQISGEVWAYRASSNSSSPSWNIFSFLYCSTNALRRRSRSNWSIIRLKSYCAVTEMAAVSTNSTQQVKAGDVLI